jgi:2-polyprenyl-3-methyl-5-hydroxy-6-metoxy-1,4-benzoquinol methylase
LDYDFENLVEVQKCLKCKLVYTEQIPTKDEREKYQSGAYSKKESIIHRLSKPFLKLLEANKLLNYEGDINGLSFLEIGCGKGNLLLTADSRGLKAEGLDINIRVSEEVLNQKIPLHASSSNELAQKGKIYDLIMLWHVLEHIPTLKDFYKSLLDLSKKNTQIVIAVPNYSSFQSKVAGKYWYHLDPNRHLSHFTPNCLKKQLEENGFSVSNVSYNSFYQNFIGEMVSIGNLLFKIKNFPFNLVRSREKLIERFGLFQLVITLIGYSIYCLVFTIPLLIWTLLSELFKKAGTMIFLVKPKT